MVEKRSDSEHNLNTPNGHVQNGVSAPHTLHTNTIELNFVQNKLRNFQNTVLQDVQHRMSTMVDEIMQELRQRELQMHEFKNFAKIPQEHTNNTWNNRVATEQRQQQSEHDDARSKLEAINDKLNNAATAADDDEVQSTTTTSSAGSASKTTTRGYKQSRRRALPDKVFIMRESYLTALLEVDHMKTIYHIFYIILLVLFMNSICYDYFVEGRVNFGLGTFKSGLKGIHYVFGIWSLEHVFVFCIFYAFKGWALVRTKLAGQKPLQRFWTHSCLITYISSQLVFGYIASVMCLKLDLPFVSASVLLLETARLLMKMHAFVRFNAARVLAGKLKTDDDDATASAGKSAKQTAIRLPQFSCYLYFLFAPTLIYRDSYPRTSQIRWRFATARFLEVIAVAFLYSYIHERHIKVHFFHYGREELNESQLIVKLFGMIMPSVIILLCGFYLILHSWLNFTAELLRFGDRMFYKDWWTASSYDAYYRNWNVVVHDWLYEYIYKDFYNHVFKGSKVGASLMVFLVSALVHEHVLGFALQLFFPIMFVFFGFVGVSMVYITRRAPKDLGNIIIWASLIFGNALMISLYAMEYYARINCPKSYETWIDYLTPAVANCYKN